MQKHAFPDGHYYSSIPDIEDILARKEQIFKQKKPNIIPRNHNREKSILLELSKYYPAPFPVHKTPPFRYYYENECFSYSDVFLIYLIFQKEWVFPIHLPKN